MKKEKRNLPKLRKKRIDFQSTVNFSRHNSRDSCVHEGFTVARKVRSAGLRIPPPPFRILRIPNWEQSYVSLSIEAGAPAGQRQLPVERQRGRDNRADRRRNVDVYFTWPWVPSIRSFPIRGLVSYNSRQRHWPR